MGMLILNKFNGGVGQFSFKTLAGPPDKIIAFGLYSSKLCSVTF